MPGARRDLERQLGQAAAPAAAAVARRAPARRRLPAGDEARRRRLRRAARRASSPRAATRSRRHGEAQWNGVAILSRVGLEDVVVGIPGAPGFPHAEARRVSRDAAAASACTRSTSPTGAMPDSDHYRYKLAWLAALREQIVGGGPADAMVCGDMNIAPTDERRLRPRRLRRPHPRHRARARGARRAAGGRAARRRARALARRARVHLLGLPRRACSTRTSACASTSCSRARPSRARVRAAWVDRQARKGSGPSDHAPVIVDLDEAPDGDIGPVVPPPSAPAPRAAPSSSLNPPERRRAAGRPVSPGARALSAGSAREGWQTVGRAASATPGGRDRSEC